MVCKDSSTGRPAAISVDSWRVNSAISSGDMARRTIRRVPGDLGHVTVLRRPAAGSTAIGIKSRSRSAWRTCRLLSPSSTPLRWRPLLSMAVYSNAATAQTVSMPLAPSIMLTRMTSCADVAPEYTLARPSSAMPGLVRLA